MKKFVYGLLAFTPMLASAASFNEISNLTGEVGGIVGQIIPIMFALVIVYFFWGVAEYVRSAGDPKKAAEGKSIMIYGVIAIAVMASLWGLVGWLRSAVGITNNPSTVTAPTVNF